MRNDVLLHGGARRGPKMDVASNKSKDWVANYGVP